MGLERLFDQVDRFSDELSDGRTARSKQGAAARNGGCAAALRLNTGATARRFGAAHPGLTAWAGIWRPSGLESLRASFIEEARSARAGRKAR
jgi:hypothetical protein